MRLSTLSEVALSPAELKKRDNIETFIRKVEKGEAFVKAGETEPSIVIKHDPEMIAAMRDGTFPSTMETEDGQIIRLSNLQKTTEFGSTGGTKKETSERQEHGLIEIINQHSGLTVETLDKKVKEARDNPGLNKQGNEPYIDIFVTDMSGKDYGVSCKGPSAPSLGGGGAAGLNSINPDLFKKTFDTIKTYFEKTMDWKQGDIVKAEEVPDLFIKIPEHDIELLIKGNEDMGGPIDYMYVGPMDVEGEADDKTLKLNGKFYTIDDYLDSKGDFYIRMRKRDIAEDKTVQIEFEQLNVLKYPKILKNPHNNKTNMRLVVTDTVPKNANVIDLK